jgi:hypothetical protein
MQTILDGERGDCYRACLASILELALEDVPHVCLHADWRERTVAFLRPFGLGLLTVNVFPEDYPRELFPDAWHVMAGPGQRGVRHAVVGRRAIMLHDPHPSGAGLLSIEEYDFFLALDPSRRNL